MGPSGPETSGRIRRGLAWMPDTNIRGPHAPYIALPYSTLLYSTLRYYTIRYYTIVILYYTLLCDTVLLLLTIDTAPTGKAFPRSGVGVPALEILPKPKNPKP